MKKSVIGILAHVDAGKTTLAEALLYASGKLLKLGRVDKRTSFLDTEEIERERGITVFSKQAYITYGESEFVLLDTPGHTDFSAEAERTLSVLDYAVLVISGTDGVQAHTETLWKLLEMYNIPTFVFVTKMDISLIGRDKLMNGLERLSDGRVIDFTTGDAESKSEKIALCDEDALDKFINGVNPSEGDIKRLIKQRKIYPCFFGSGLKLDGIDGFLGALDAYTEEGRYVGEFVAQVYKITYDGQIRLTHLKVIGGELVPRLNIKYSSRDGEVKEEKITLIRRYHGTKFDAPDKVPAGDICAVSGLTATYAGQRIGAESDFIAPYLEPVLNYRIVLPNETEPEVFLPKLRMLEEEEPLLHIVWNERFSEIHAQIMGHIQTEILERIIFDRFDVKIGFADEQIMYRETISAPVEGVGHFEPLRHYAEVHLRLEPLPQGTGLVFDTDVPPNMLDINWQRLILTHLREKTHLGVLTGSPITDMKITLVAGRAHLKHTEGGDFREATYRAVRHGLMQALASENAVLLEPFYSFRIEVPQESVGRVISDIISKSGQISEHNSLVYGKTEENMSVLVGRAPVSEMSGYTAEIASYTHGKGRISCRYEGYFPCHNADEVMEKYAYNPTSDLYNSPDSVFCAHGAGFTVPWNEVTEYMHIDLQLFGKDEFSSGTRHRRLNIDDVTLDAIMTREFGTKKKSSEKIERKAPEEKEIKVNNRDTMYIIDGYNVIFAFDELAQIAKTDLENARNILCEILANHRSFTGKKIILVFDAYRVPAFTDSSERKYEEKGINIVYTKENQLADNYIEGLISEIGRDYSVKVVTNDGLIQLQALRSGVLRVPAREFYNEIIETDEEIKAIIGRLAKQNKNSKISDLIKNQHKQS